MKKALLAIFFFTISFTCSAVYVWALRLADTNGKIVDLLGDIHQNPGSVDDYAIPFDQVTAIKLKESLQGRILIEHVVSSSIPILFECMDGQDIAHALDKKREQGIDKFINMEKRDLAFSTMITSAITQLSKEYVSFALDGLREMKVERSKLEELLISIIKYGKKHEGKSSDEYSWEAFDQKLYQIFLRINELQKKIGARGIDQRLFAVQVTDSTVEQTGHVIRLGQLISSQISRIFQPNYTTETDEYGCLIRIYKLTEVTRGDLEYIDAVQEKLKTNSHIIVSCGCMHTVSLLAFLKEKGFSIQWEVNKKPSSLEKPSNQASETSATIKNDISNALSAKALRNFLMGVMNQPASSSSSGSNA